MGKWTVFMIMACFCVLFVYLFAQDCNVYGYNVNVNLEKEGNITREMANSERTDNEIKTLREDLKEKELIITNLKMDMILMRRNFESRVRQLRNTGMQSLEKENVVKDAASRQNSNRRISRVVGSRSDERKSDFQGTINDIRKIYSDSLYHQTQFSNELMHMFKDNNMMLQEMNSKYSNRFHEKIQIIMDNITQQMDILQHDFSEQLILLRKTCEIQDLELQNTLTDKIKLFAELQNNIKDIKNLIHQMNNEHINQGENAETFNLFLSSLVKDIQNQPALLMQKMEQEKIKKQNNKSSIYTSSKNLITKNEKDVKKMMEILKNIEIRNRRIGEQIQKLILLDLSETEESSNVINIQSIFNEAIFRLNESAVKMSQQCALREQKRDANIAQYLLKASAVIEKIEHGERKIEKTTQNDCETSQKAWRKLQGDAESTYRYQSTILQKFTEDDVNYLVNFRKIFDEYITKLENKLDKQTEEYQNMVREGLENCQKIQSTLLEKYSHISPCTD